MEALIDVIKDIREKFDKKSFKDEQHVRFSLVGRICYALGWNIWDPEEFYTEYPVKRYPPQEITTELRGRVDVALILPEKHSDIAEVFIEIKNPYKLQTELVSGETQLKRYNWWDKSAISSLTDGVTWRFYLPSIGGAFENSLFSEIDLVKDDIDDTCAIFDQVLRRDNFRKKAVESAEDIYEEIGRIKKLSLAKSEAEDIARKTGMQKFTIAQQLLKNQHNFEIEIDEIERLWQKKIPKVTQPPSQTNIKPKHPLQPPLNPNAIKVYINNNGVNASGEFNLDSKQFTLLKGSEIVKHHKPTFRGKYLELKNDMIKDGRLCLDSTGTKYVLNVDLILKAPSPASYLVLGRSSSGWIDWLDEQGKKLDEHRK
jgi:predicted type IV restriction endonuclease